MTKERLSYEEVEVNLAQGGTINVQTGYELHLNGDVFVNGTKLEPVPPIVTEDESE